MGSGILTTLRDFARIGWLWSNWGKWDEQQEILKIIPTAC